MALWVAVWLCFAVFGVDPTGHRASALYGNSIVGNVSDAKREFAKNRTQVGALDCRISMRGFVFGG